VLLCVKYNDAGLDHEVILFHSGLRLMLYQDDTLVFRIKNSINKSGSRDCPVYLFFLLIKSIFSICFYSCIFSTQLFASPENLNPQNLISEEKATTLSDSTWDEDDTFWLLLNYEPPQNILWLFAGADDSDGNYYGVSTDLIITDSLHFNLYAAQQNFSSESTELSWGFSGSFNKSFGWGLSQYFWGKTSKLEKNDRQLTLSYFNEGFNSRVSYETGDVELFFNEIFKAESASVDHSASELSLGYSWAEFYWQLSYKKHHYNKDLSFLERSLLLQIYFDPVGIQQASALAETESSILGGFQRQTISYEAYLSRIKSAVSRETDTYVSLRLVKAINDQLQLSFNLDLPIQNTPLSGGLSLGYMW